MRTACCRCAVYAALFRSHARSRSVTTCEIQRVYAAEDICHNEVTGNYGVALLDAWSNSFVTNHCTRDSADCRIHDLHHPTFGNCTGDRARNQTLLPEAIRIKQHLSNPLLHLRAVFSNIYANYSVPVSDGVADTEAVHSSKILFHSITGH